jgi:hypothetical protein
MRADKVTLIEASRTELPEVLKSAAIAVENLMKKQILSQESVLI